MSATMEASRGTDDAKRFAAEFGRPARLQLVGNVTRAALLFLHQLLVARLFGAGVLGVFALATSATQVAGMISHLGGDYVILKGAGGSRRDPESALRAVIVPASIASTSVCVVLLVLASFTTVFGTDERLPQAFAIAAPTVITVAATSLIAALFQAKRQLRDYTTIQTLLEPALRVIALLALLPLIGDWRLSLWSYALACIATLVVAMWRVSRIQVGVLGPVDVRDGVLGLGYSVPVMLSFVLQSATLFVNVTLLNRLATPEAAGVFSAAMRLAMLALWAQMAMSAPFLPVVSGALTDSGSREQLARVYRRIVRFVILFNAPLLGLLFVGRGAFLALFGPGFAAASSALAVLLAGQLVNTATAAIEGILPLGGKANLGLMNNATQLAINVALAAYLIPLLGVAGAGIAVASSVIVINVLRTLQVWHYWRIQPFSLGLIRMLACGVIIVITTELLFPIPATTKSPLIAIAFATALGLFILVACFAVTGREDRAVLGTLLPDPLGRTFSTLGD